MRGSPRGHEAPAGGQDRPRQEAAGGSLAVTSNPSLGVSDPSPGLKRSYTQGALSAPALFSDLKSDPCIRFTVWSRMCLSFYLQG